MPADYDQEKWVELYKKAILELEHAKMTGRIGDARTELAARVEQRCTSRTRLLPRFRS